MTVPPKLECHSCSTAEVTRPGVGRRTYLCGIRKSVAGTFTYGAGGWPFAQVSIDDATVTVGPAFGPLLLLAALGPILALLLDRWPASLLLLAAVYALFATPRRSYSIGSLRARRAVVNLTSGAIGLSTDTDTDELYLWCLPTDKVLAAIAGSGGHVEDS